MIARMVIVPIPLFLVTFAVFLLLLLFAGVGLWYHWHQRRHDSKNE